jgi:hypothetical protein
MITTAHELSIAEADWKAKRGDATAFADASYTLNSARCQVDVENMLTNPTFAISVISGAGTQQIVADITVGPKHMLRYTLTEHATYTTVEIHP